MIYLVDANILSEPTKHRPNEKVVAWLRANETNFVIDSVILGEIALGIRLIPRGRKRSQLERWFETVVECIDCLAWDPSTSKRWAQLVADSRNNGQTLPILDSMIAATALAHGLIVVTHNVRDFQKAGVPVLDPFV